MEKEAAEVVWEDSDVDLTKDNPKLANLPQEDREKLEKPYIEAQAIYKQVAEKEVLRRDKDKERLYTWTPGTRKKPISNKFIDMLDRYNNPKRRYLENLSKWKEDENTKYKGVLEEQ